MNKCHLCNLNIEDEVFVQIIKLSPSIYNIGYKTFETYESCLSCIKDNFDNSLIKTLTSTMEKLIGKFVFNAMFTIKSCLYCSAAITSYNKNYIILRIYHKEYATLDELVICENCTEHNLCL